MQKGHSNRRRSQGFVYILHLRTGLPRSNGQAAIHYVGWARNWIWRIRAHRAGVSRARMIEVAYERGIPLDIAVVVRGGPELERAIKRGGHYNRWCPLCGGRLVDYRWQ